MRALPWLVAGACALATLAAFDRLERPFAAVFLVWAVACLAFAAGGPRKRRPLWFNAGFVLLALGVAELAVGPDRRRSEGEGCGRAERREPHPRLGYAFAPNATATCRFYYGDELLYESTSSIGPDGLRVAPAPRRDVAVEACVVFFGGSFVFGAGVDDDEALPYLVGARSGGRTRVYNFGAGGYGPHQMLAALESGFAAERLDCEPTHVVYLGIFDHARRVAGLGHWGASGPRYLLEDGELRDAGMFEDQQSALGRLGTELARRSAILRRLRSRSAEADEDAERLFAAVVLRAAARVAERYPDARFHVLYWDQWDGDRTLFPEAVEAAGLPLHRVSEILPGLAEGGYNLHRHDGHPNPRAHALLADYVTREILGAEPLSP